MGRPPCCDKEGVKKGPWTPEEDIILVSYIQEHGPGNWRSVPTNTGLLRCSKSCRLRWTNYLRPGIRRGNFTDQEEKLIVHLQALLGNRWAAIASYLPERTDNDIKNYWNTHLSKKLRRAGEEGGAVAAAKGLSKGQWERRVQADIHTAKQALREALCTTAAAPPPLPPAGVYASSTENISRLLKDWMRGSPGPGSTQLSSTGPGRAAESSSSSVCDENPAAACSSTPEATDGSRPEETQLSVLEKWLFDELSVSLEDDYGLF